MKEGIIFNPKIVPTTEFKRLLKQFHDEGEKRPVELFRIKVLGIVKNHPDGITVVGITEELGGSVNFSRNEGGLVPDNTVF